MDRELIHNDGLYPKNLLTLVASKDADYWAKVREKTMLKLFHAAADRVPAYKDFLKKNGVKASAVRNLKDLSLVPTISKDNYLRAYPHRDLVWDGDIRKPLTIHSTSGSTGEPTYFQRELASDFRRQFIINHFFRNNDATITGPTLFVITFGMGMWSAGMGIYTAAYLANNLNRYPISIVTPGVNKVEVLKIFRTIAPRFKQVIVAGYPPFVKDIIDEAREGGIDLSAFDMRFIFTGEAFTEEFRDYLAERAGVKNVFIDTMNTYGTSELGATAVETPLSIMVRRLADRALFHNLFGDITKVPTLAQYIPHFVNFDCINGELFFTGDSAIPLVRYESGDHGGMLSFDEVSSILKKNGTGLDDATRKAGIAKHIAKLPFVFVYERKNLATTLYGILIYPEFLKGALLKKPFNDLLTGKFTMIQRYDEKQNQYLEVNIELKRGATASNVQKEAVMREIVDTLKARSSEFTELCRNLGEAVYPKMKFWPYEHKEFFTPGAKQQWVRKH